MNAPTRPADAVLAERPAGRLTGRSALITGASRGIVMQAAVARVPLNRFLQPREIADLALYLGSGNPTAPGSRWCSTAAW